MPALAVVFNAIVDALSEFGVRHIEMPATPETVWRALNAGARDATHGARSTGSGGAAPRHAEEDRGQKRQRSDDGVMHGGIGVDEG